MEIREWNIGLAATIPSNNGYKLNSWIIDEITKDEPDCIVLTEFVVSYGIEYYFEKLREKGYYWFISSSTKQNGILIALKKHTFDFEETMDYYKDSVLNSEIFLERKDLMDFYEVIVKWNGEPLSIIGIRIRSDITEEDKAYTGRQLANLDKYLSRKKGKIICVGDFNAYWGPYGWGNEKYSLRETSNYFSLYTPKFKEGENWFSYVFYNGNKAQLDHLITNITNIKNRNIQVIYDWSFINSERYGSKVNKDVYKPSGLPDHAILKAIIE